MLIALTSIMCLHIIWGDPEVLVKGVWIWDVSLWWTNPFCHWHHHRWNEKGKRYLDYSCFLPKLIRPGSGNKENTKCSAFHLRNSTCFLGLLSETARLLSPCTQLPSHPVQNSPFREQSKRRDQVNTAMVMYSSRSDSPLSVKGLMLLNSKNLLG